MENDWSGTLQNNNIICIFTQKIKLFQLNKYDHSMLCMLMQSIQTRRQRIRLEYMSHFAYACKMRYPLNLVLENIEYL